MLLVQPVKVFLCLVCFTFSLLGSVAVAQEQTLKEKKISIYKQDLARIENYLNSLKTYVAAFRQYAGSEESLGKFYLSRPGKLRWEYEQPTPIVIVANGSLLTYYDAELDQISNVALDDSLSHFLIRQRISFSEGMKVTAYDKTKDFMRLTVVQEGKEDEGELIMAFRPNPVELIEMEVIDALGKKTHIVFEGSATGVPLKDSLFTVHKKQKRKR